VNFFIKLKELFSQYHPNNGNTLGQFVAPEQARDSGAVLLIGFPCLRRRTCRRACGGKG